MVEVVAAEKVILLEVMADLAVEVKVVLPVHPQEMSLQQEQLLMDPMAVLVYLPLVAVVQAV
jgi:hypothetical protein